jgi:hypothetical protein
MLEEHGINTFHGPRMWVGTAIALVLILLLCWGLIVATKLFLRSLDILAMTSPEAAILRAGLALRVLGAVMGGLALATAAYTVRMSKLVILNRQMPPPGAWVLGNPKIVLGDRAALFGYVGYGLAALLSVIGVVVVGLLWHYVSLMTSGVVPI